MAVNYKILFEVKLLHEYYLTEKDGSTIFDLPQQQDRLDFLNRQASLNAASISGNVSFGIPEAVKNIFTDHKLRIINSESGFKVFAAVKKETLPGNIKAYRPAVAMPDDLPIMVNINSRNGSLETISNSPVKNPLSGSYYFTSRDTGLNRLFPFLARPLSIRDDAADYEQGEIVLDPADLLTKVFFFEKDGTKNWAEVKGEGVVNRNDILLVSGNFEYRFFEADGNGEASFKLKDASGATFSSQNHTVSGLSRKVTLNFANVVPLLLNGSVGNNPEVFKLEVSLAGGPVKTHLLVFCKPELDQEKVWGLVHLQPRVGSPVFNLLDDDGLLVTRENADGSKVSYPIFELRIKSRFAFWKYQNNKNEKILDNAALHPYLIYDPQGFFETKKMLNATYNPVELSAVGSTQFLPNPENDLDLAIEGKRIYATIRVPQSGLFKV